MRDLYAPYQTPAGCHDVPFIYLFDGNDLVNGDAYTNKLSVQMDGDAEFILRRIAGFPTVSRYFTYRNMSGSYAWQPFIEKLDTQGDISVVPEKLYKPRSAIRFDVGAVAKNVAVEDTEDFIAYIAFQGVKRFPWDVEPQPCNYRLRNFMYVLNIPAVDWTRGQFRRFSLRIDKTGDFELYRIIQLNGTNVPDTRVGVFNYMLYDPNGWQMMSAPVPDSYVTDQIQPILSATNPYAQPSPFPTPGMLYPRMSQIKVDLHAVQSIAQGDCWQIVFDGAERIPLDGNTPVWA